MTFRALMPAATMITVLLIPSPALAGITAPSATASPVTPPMTHVRDEATIGSAFGAIGRVLGGGALLILLTVYLASRLRRTGRHGDLNV